MALYTRATRIRAPFERVWRFHARPEGLLALTPGWVGLRIESAVGPTGDPDPQELSAGSAVVVSVRPFGVGPRRGWRSVIEERRRDDGAGLFRDRMESGPFDRWEHTHAFYADDGSTVVRDRVDYELAGGSVGPVLSRLAVVGLGPTFRYRHRRTRQLLEAEEWGGWD